MECQRAEEDTGVELSIIVPVYHAAGHLGAWREALDPVLSHYGTRCEVLLVDDGSTDGSWGIIAGWAREDPRFRAFGFARNFGQHAAITAGFERARGRVVMTVDDDLQIPLDVVPRFVAAINAGSDVVSGFRVHRQDPLIFRRLPSMVLNTIFRIVTGSARRDFGCNHVAYRSWVIRAILACPDRSRFTPELVAWVGGRCDEIDVPHRSGPSRYRLATLMRLNLLLLTRYTFWPLYVVSMVAGLLSLGAAFIVPSGSLMSAEVIPRAVLGFSGVILFVVGLVSNSIERLHEEATGRPLYVIHPDRVEDRNG